ncbi:zinc finger, RING/FYVE/PHD-type containing protein [Tanacetum coccineum]
MLNDTAYNFHGKLHTLTISNVVPSCLMPMSPEHRDDDSDSDNSDASSVCELGRYDNNNGIESNRNGRMEAREPIEQNVRFNITLTVGRLRDRVLQRPTVLELASFPFQQEQEVTSGSDVRETESRSSNENVSTPATSLNYSISSMTNPLYGDHEFEVENLGSRDNNSYDNLLEHRFTHYRGWEVVLRINLVTKGLVYCRVSIRRDIAHVVLVIKIQLIVPMQELFLLAEALFEVLDEIHQQSVVSSSRPALSSIGSEDDCIQELVEKHGCKKLSLIAKHLAAGEAPTKTRGLLLNTIRALYNVNIREGFRIGKDVSLPTTYVRSTKSPLKDVGAKAFLLLDVHLLSVQKVSNSSFLMI